MKELHRRYAWIPYLLLALIVLFLTQNGLSPFDAETFSGHDETQAARVIEFTRSIQEGRFPPRISTMMSHGGGFPIFSYYAPAAYWITSMMTGVLPFFSIPNILELSYLAALIVGAWGMYRIGRREGGIPAGMVAATAFVASPYVATEIFVRANLAEVWFFGLLPWGVLGMRTHTLWKQILSIVILALLFSVHTIMSPLALIFMIVITLVVRSWRAGFIILSALFLSASYLLPATTEIGEIQARTIASITQPLDHLVCPIQLWSSTWGYGGSAPGCSQDGMSFMIGKIQLILGGLGAFVYLLFQTLRAQRTPNSHVVGVIFLLLAGSIFFSLTVSYPFWEHIRPLHIMQFPWRFLLFALFGLAFFSGYAIQFVPGGRLRTIGAILVVVALMGMNQKFFIAEPVISDETFLRTYASDAYIKDTAAYRVAEYLPVSVDYKAWRNLEEHLGKRPAFWVTSGDPQAEIIPIDDRPFRKEVRVRSAEPITLHVHAAPYWRITLDDTVLTKFTTDKLGYPIVPVSAEEMSTITVTYVQTTIQHIGNTISLITAILMGAILVRHYVWKPRKKS